MSQFFWPWVSAEAVSALPIREPAPLPGNTCLVCEQCGFPIEDGDESVFMIIGVAGRGEMSAQPMVVENSEVLFPPRVNLHFCCVTDYVLGKETEPQ